MPDPRRLAIERLCWRGGVQSEEQAEQMLETLERAGLLVGLPDALADSGGGRVTPPALGNPFGPEPKTSPEAPDPLLAQCTGGTFDPPPVTELSAVQASNPAARCLSCRVDALYLAFEVEVCREEEGRLFAPDDRGKRDWQSKSGLCFQVRNTRAPGVAMFDNADMRAKLDIDDESGFGLEVILRATFLATHPIDECLALVQRFAEDLGKVKGLRVRRIDLAADFAGWSLLGIETEAWVVQRRAGLVDYAEVPVEVHHQCARLTGFTVGKCALRMRVYDKRQELRFRSDREKTAVEEKGWTEAGWNGTDEVSRVEFQLRGVAMDQLDLRDARRIADRLDPVWQYLVNDWVRLAVPDTATRRKNWTLDPRWAVVRTVTFVHQAHPAERIRRRGGAKIRYTHGCVLSSVAALGKMPPPKEVPGEVLPKLVGRQSTPGEYERACERAIRMNLSALYHAAKTEDADDIIREFGAIDGWAWLKRQINSVRARFWSSRDGPFIATRGPESSTVESTGTVVLERPDDGGSPPPDGLPPA